MVLGGPSSQELKSLDLPRGCTLCVGRVVPRTTSVNVRLWDGSLETVIAFASTATVQALKANIAGLFCDKPLAQP